MKKQMAIFALSLTALAGARVHAYCEEVNDKTDRYACLRAVYKNESKTGRDDKLQRLYNQITANLDAARQAGTLEDLIASERGWVSSKERNCDAESQQFQIKINKQNAFMDCVLRYTDARISTLRVNYANWIY